ncbi:hypothetical protein COLO4_11358 [Corchorus olitorius]|uniref:TF-B3 domain-containing protein n=1 Tax=Corchorus olitorius TaxID=93759 RepID=A0A1R3K4T7_9ROSI|nr:hypothetical protein COLO4_11358 [Corchorus olitorius]
MALQHGHGRWNGHLLEPHHFFKIVLEDAIQEGKLKIPSRFARDYGNALSNPVLLKVPTGAMWEVELTKCDGKIWLENGWKKFSEHYSLKHGYFLVFRLEGNSQFHVLIFDTSASEIKYPNGNRDEEIQPQEVKIEESEEEESIQIIDDISACRRDKPELQCGRPYKMMRTNPGDKTENITRFGCHNGSSVGKHVGKSTAVCRQLNSFEKSKVLQRAGFNSHNPYFILVMQSTYVGLGARSMYLAIPTDFARKHLKDDHGIIQKPVGLPSQSHKPSSKQTYEGASRQSSMRPIFKTVVRASCLKDKRVV